MTATTATVACHASSAPQQMAADGTKTWLTCGANFVVAVSQVEVGAILERRANPDEAMVFLPDAGVAIEAGGDRVEVTPDSLAILPPGDSRIVVHDTGTVVRVFSHRARDLYAQGVNAADYASGIGVVAPLVDGPPPPGGFRLRVYRLADYAGAGNMRVFRSTNLMMNPLLRRPAPRDVTTLSPHSHADFEQASLVLEGRYMHHVRYPWGPDMAAWRADEHLEACCPSVTIIPPTAIHTSRNIGGPGYLVDVFAPPRVDFEQRGIVCNAADYPVWR